MAITGNEPISAANLAEVIEALRPMMGGVLLYSSPSEHGAHSGTLSRDCSGFDLLLVTLYGSTYTNVSSRFSLTMRPGETLRYPDHDNRNYTLSMSGTTFSCQNSLNSGPSVTSIVGLNLTT